MYINILVSSNHITIGLANSIMSGRTPLYCTLILIAMHSEGLGAFRLFFKNKNNVPRVVIIYDNSAIEPLLFKEKSECA